MFEEAEEAQSEREEAYNRRDEEVVLVWVWVWVVVVVVVVDKGVPGNMIINVN